MGGYLGKWGGYAKVMLPFGSHVECVPTATVGAVKQIYKFIYLYLGAGYAPVNGFRAETYYVDEKPYHLRLTEYDSGVIFETGAIFKFNKFNFSAGYAISAGVGFYTNHSIQSSFGYCF